MENAEEFGICGIARIDVPGVTSREKWFVPNDLDPGKPDYIGFAYDNHDGTGSGQPPETGINLIETGPNTKVFIKAQMQLNLWMRGDLSTYKRSAITAYIRQWSTDKDYSVELLESAPGSRRFISADGNVIYELGYVYDHKYNLVKAPSSVEVNSLYFYITDANLNLSRLPFIVKETDAATNEYQSTEYAWYKQLKSWAQVQQELKESQFHIQIDGELPEDERTLEISWTDGLGHKRIVTDHLVETEKGKYKTETPLVAFSKQGCDVEGKQFPESYAYDRSGVYGNVYGLDYDPSSGRTAKISTPHTPGAISIRYTHGLEMRVGSYHALLRTDKVTEPSDFGWMPPFFNPDETPEPPRWHQWATRSLIAGVLLAIIWFIVTRRKRKVIAA